MPRSMIIIPVLATCVFACKEPAPKANPGLDETAVKKEVQELMNKYGDWGRQSQYDSIAGLYHKNGASFVNFQKTEYASFDSIKASYKDADSIAFFTWNNPLIIDVISSDVATVAGDYLLRSKSITDTLHFNYSAVLVKDGNAWKIKQENEMPDITSAKKIAALLEKNN